MILDRCGLIAVFNPDVFHSNLIDGGRESVRFSFASGGSWGLKRGPFMCRGFDAVVKACGAHRCRSDGRFDCVGKTYAAGPSLEFLRVWFM